MCSYETDRNNVLLDSVDGDGRDRHSASKLASLDAGIGGSGASDTMSRRRD